MPVNLTGENLIAGSLSSLGVERVNAQDRGANQDVGPSFCVATSQEIASACKAASIAFDEFGELPGNLRADFLERIATELGEVSEEAVARAQLETALPNPRLVGEVGRTQNQLRMFARLIREGSWVDAKIDHGDPERKPLPKPDLRRMLVPLGPVAVFGASNFPFAYSVAGGDTASALAAGCPVVVKAHPAHPGTCEIVGRAVRRAVQECGLPAGVFSMLHGGSGVGAELVENDHIEAVGFTGSFAAGRAIAKLAFDRPRPIPVFAEMGSVNPIVILPSALENGSEAIAKNFSASLTLGVGQFCTNPGLIFGVGSAFEMLCTQIESALAELPAGVMLTEAIQENFIAKTAHLDARLGKSDGEKGMRPRIYRTTAPTFLADETLLEEVFGPSAIAIKCVSIEELALVLSKLPGQLTATVHADHSDPVLGKFLHHHLKRIAGRLILNGYPTGVEVCSAMQHGGPFPATTDSRSTSVGTAAILRFVRPVAYQDLPDVLLPEALREANPLGIVRTVDGSLTLPQNCT
jgi:alpha-ketoglutaric semialdehyde dehydrogenase